MDRHVFIVHRDHTEGEASIVGVYSDEEYAKDIFRAVEKYGSSDYTFSLVVAKVTESTRQDNNAKD